MLVSSFQEISFPLTHPASGFHTCPAWEGREMGCKNNYSDSFLTSPVQVSLSSIRSCHLFYSGRDNFVYRVDRLLTTNDWGIANPERWWEGGGMSHFSTKNKIQSPFQRRGNMWHLQEESLFSHQSASRSTQKRMWCPSMQQIRELSRLRLEGQKQQMHPQFPPFVKIWVGSDRKRVGGGEWFHCSGIVLNIKKVNILPESKILHLSDHEFC